METFAEQAVVAIEYGRLQGEPRRLALLEDRERIAKELHDGAIQALFAVGMSLQGLGRAGGRRGAARLPPGRRRGGGRVIRDLRNYIFGLRPGILADRQLDQALQRLCEEFQERLAWSRSPRSTSRWRRSWPARRATWSSWPARLFQRQPARRSRHLPGVAVQGRGWPGAGGGRRRPRVRPAAATGAGQGLRNLSERAEHLGGRAEIHSTPAREPASSHHPG